MSRGLGPPRTALLIGALLLALLGPGAAAARAAGESVVSLLERRRAGGPDAPLAARELAALGPEAAPEVFALSSGRLPDLGALQAEERELLHALVRSWSAEEAVAALLEALPQEATLDDRLTLLGLVGEAGGRWAIEAVWTLCTGLDAALQAHPLVVRTVEETLVRALGSDSRAFEALARRLEDRDLDPLLAERAAAALGIVGSGPGRPLLERLLGRSTRLDAAVLEALGQLRPFGDAGAAARVRSTLRRHLDSLQPELRRRAALALGTLRDDEAVPDLLDLLDDPDRRVGRAADRALREISGLRPARGADVWVRWYAAELDWFDHEGAGHVEDLASADLPRLVRALRVLSMHPAHRSVVAEDIRELLVTREDPTVLAAACAALAKLQDAAAFEPLLELLEDPREAVRAAAQGALVALTGATVAADPLAWRAWLEPVQP